MKIKLLEIPANPHQTSSILAWVSPINLSFTIVTSINEFMIIFYMWHFMSWCTWLHTCKTSSSKKKHVRENDFWLSKHSREISLLFRVFLIFKDTNFIRNLIESGFKTWPSLRKNQSAGCSMKRGQALPPTDTSLALCHIRDENGWSSSKRVSSFNLLNNKFV